MITTEHFNFKQYEGTDLFNPLQVEAQNIASIDDNLYDVKTAAVQTATEIKNGTVHNITRRVTGASTIRFVATSDWNKGDTVTVDGVQVSALLPTGEVLPTGAWKINANVLAILTGTVLTVYTTAPVTNVDAYTLEGHRASYFMRAEAGAVKSKSLRVLLPATDWIASGSAFIQTVAVANVTANTNLIASPGDGYWSPSINNSVRAARQAAGTVTFQANSKPANDLYFNVIILG